MRPMRVASRIVASLGALLFIAGAVAAHGIELQDGTKVAPVQEAAPQSAPSALPLDIGGPFTLMDHTGRMVSDADFHGDYMLVFFGYANCPGICPVGLRAMTQAVDLLGDKGARVAPVLITVDPENDTPANLAPAVAKIHSRLIGLTGTPDQLRSVARAYKTSAKPAGKSWQGVQMFDHGSYVYLIGPDGKFITLFPPVMDPAAMAAAIARYLG